MNSRERVQKCLRHQEADRVPIDFWAAKEITAKLLKHYNFSDKEQLLQHFDVDFRYIEGPRYIGPDHTIRADGAKEDHFGVPRKTVSFGKGESAGTYHEVAEFPLEKAASIDEIESYPMWPTAEWFDYECIRKQARQARETGKVVVFMGDRLNRCAQLKPAMYVRGIEQILIDLILYPDIAKAILKRIANFYEAYARYTLEAAEGYIDIFFTGDDFGTQNNLFMSVDVWRNFLRDGFKTFIDIGHEFSCKVAHHTCGSIVPLIPDFIQCGLDILNPLQPDVTGMDHADIKEKFGEQLTFHGAMSIQNTLPFGTPADVRNEVKDRVEQLASGGGYIFCTAHNIQSDTSLDNIEALLQAYKELGVYT